MILPIKNDKNHISQRAFLSTLEHELYEASTMLYATA